MENSSVTYIVKHEFQPDMRVTVPAETTYNYYRGYVNFYIEEPRTFMHRNLAGFSNVAAVYPADSDEITIEEKRFDYSGSKAEATSQLTLAEPMEPRVYWEKV